jgi:hypothetical protein
MSSFSAGCLILIIILLVYIHTIRANDGEEEWLLDEYIPPPPNKRDESSYSEDNTIQDSSDAENQLSNLTIKWDQLSWKALCDDEEWRGQFAKIRMNLTRCLELSAILLPEDKEDERLNDSEKMAKKMALMFSEGKSNPYCRMSRNWLQCHHFLKVFDTFVLELFIFD